MNFNLILGAAAILYGLYTAYTRATLLGAPRVEPDAVNLESDAVTLGA